MPGDNFKVEVRSAGREHFAAAIRLAWASCVGQTATHYVSPLPEFRCLECADGKKTAWEDKQPIKYKCPNCGGSGKQQPRSAMVLLWHEDHVRGVKASPLPFPLTCDAAVEFLWAWLETAEFGEEPDQDGSNERGFIVTTGDFWGHVEGCHYAFIGVYPDWQMYGK